MRLVLVHARAATVELVRYPVFSVPTVAFPALFFLFFVTPRAGVTPNLFMASFAGFAVLAVAFFQFGVGIASERESPWGLYVRTLPLGPGVRLAARVLSAMLFAAVSAGLVLAAAVATTDAGLPAARWAALSAVLLLGAIPFALLGIALGYWASPRGALPIANLLYLTLSVLGALWTTPQHLPAALSGVSPLVPTRQFGELLWGAVEGRAWQPREVLLLAAWSILFAGLAVWGYRRDEGRRFR